MPIIRADMVHETSRTTGTGAFALDAALAGPYLRFSAVCATNDLVPYTARNRDVPGEWEVGYATYSAANELTRTLVVTGSNGASAVNFSAGTKDVVLTFHATEMGRIGYALPFASTVQAAPADATTYYVGGPADAPTTTAAIRRIYFPQTGRVKRAILNILVNGTLGSTQQGTAHVRITNTTDLQIAATFQWNAQWQALALQTFDQAVTAFVDYFEIKIVTPTWTTNPTNVLYYGHVWVQ
jgi:hypothetical protein